MFNIEFGGSNSAQVMVAKFKTGGEEMETLYTNVKDLESLKALLEDVRHMPVGEYNDIIEVIDTLIWEG